MGKGFLLEVIRMLGGWLQNSVKYTKKPLIVHFTWVGYMVCEFYFNKVKILNVL